jgi:hypothetical protein
MESGPGAETAPADSRRRAARERLDWLVGLCGLPLQSERLLAELIGLGGRNDEGEPALVWWSTRALAARLQLDEDAIGEELAATGALAAWGLVKVDRRDGERVAVNLRIARFLIG